MTRKLGGLVCDNDECRKFVPFSRLEETKSWIVAQNIKEEGDPKNHVYGISKEFCSKECAQTECAQTEAK